MSGWRYSNPNALEIHVVTHCNLTCRHCSHRSPVFRQEYISPAQVRSDLRRLQPYYEAKYCTLIGGEPLLHPELSSLVGEVRGAGIAPRLKIITNGTQLSRVTPSSLSRVDHVEISMYPDVGPSLEEIRQLVGTLKRRGQIWEVRQYTHFRQAHLAHDRRDLELTRRIFRACMPVHRWYCHTVYSGLFFKCPQACFGQPPYGGLPRPDLSGNGISLDASPRFPNRLEKYLDNREPLKHCGTCLGSVGRRMPHIQAGRKREPKEYSDRDSGSIDLTFLSNIEARPSDDDGCSVLRFRSD